jgi:PIN domain
MDVILDSNAYLSDARMESIRFKNLFDYLRRTKSSLVVPHLVREETVARYRHMLESQTKKTEQAVDSLNRLIIDPDSRIHIHSPLAKYEIRDLRKKFRAPSKGVAVRYYYPETECVDIADIYLRGIHRRRPANRDGEELRDVILWLLVLRYAETEKKEVGFVTNDNGFWDEGSVHAHIREDIEKRGVKVSVFRMIEDFVRLSAPAPAPVNEAEASSLFDIMTVSAEIAEATRTSLAAERRGPFGRGVSTQSVQLLRATFSKGTLYQINEDTQFFELEYAVEVSAQDSIAANSYEPLGEQQLPGLLGVNLRHDVDAVIRPGLGFLADLNLNPFAPSVPPGMRVVVRNIVTKYKVLGTAHVSIRAVRGAQPEIEMDRVEVSKIETLR